VPESRICRIIAAIREWTMPLDKDDDPQRVELFARFGQAFYMANVVEDQLVLTLMQIEFARTKEEFVKAKGKGFDRAKIAADWDSYEKKQRKKMMGELRDLVVKSADFQPRLEGPHQGGQGPSESPSPQLLAGASCHDGDKRGTRQDDCGVDRGR
jgi:hypothetical protein